MSKSPSLRRIQADIRELALDPSDRYHASPLESDMFEWHFTIRGADGTDFEGGIYHGRILLPPEYPFKPPHIILLTPSGRFETNTKVCLSFSAYHPELWQPAWGIRLILEALISFLPTPADGAVGALDWSPNERKRLATASVKYECPTCGKTADLLPKLDEEVKKTKPQTRFQKEIQQLHMMQMQEHTQDEEEETDGDKEAAEPKVNETENRQGKQTESTKDGALEELPENVPNLEEELQRQQENKPAEPEAEERVVAVPQPGAQPVAQPQVAPEVAATVQPDLYENGSSWLSDPVLQGAIAVLATISFLLLRKVQALIDDLRALE